MSDDKPGHEPNNAKPGSWVDIIRAVQTPLGMLALIALIVFTLLTPLAVQGNESLVVYSLVFILLVLVGVVAFIMKSPVITAEPVSSSNAVAPAQVPMEKASSCLRTRDELPYLPVAAAGASEILVCAISGVSIIAPLSHFWETILCKGCNLRILLLDPESSAVATWETLGRFAFAATDVRRSLDNLHEIRRQVGSKGISPTRCVIRLSETYLPCSMIIVDPGREGGWMLVEYHAYKAALGERPHILLRRDKDPHWFEFYKSQFEKLWDASPEWDPPAAITGQ